MNLISTLVLFALTPVAVAQLGLRLKTGDPNNPSFDVKRHKTLNPKSGLTIEAWITYDDSDLPSGFVQPTLFRGGDLNSTSAFLLRVEPGSTKARRLRFFANSSFAPLWCTYDFPKDRLKKWTHVAGTWDSITARLYVDGVQVASAAVGAPALITLGGSLRIGNGDTTSTGAEVWNGEIDEVRLWPFARTPAEIKSTMSMSLKNVPGQVSTWNMDFSTRDSSGNNTGTTVGSPFAGNTLQLTSVTDIGGAPFGSATPACADPVAGVTSRATSGNSAFALTCIGGASSVGGGRGFLWLGLGKLSTPVVLSNAKIWVDTLQPGILMGITANVYGYYRIALPLPTLPVGTKVHTQFGWTGGCAAPLYTSSGFTITIQNP